MVDLNTLTQNLREALCKTEAVELPTFPGLLPYPWSHPEVLSRLFNSGSGDWFGFPLLVNEGDLKAPADSCCNGFLWVQKPFTRALFPKVQELIAAALGIDETWPGTAFQLSGWAFPPTPLLETGCVWRLFCRGCFCGQIRIITALGGEQLPQPVGLVSLSLRTLTAIAIGNVGAQSIPWGKDLLLEDIQSWKSPQSDLEAEPASPQECIRRLSGRVAAGIDQALARKSTCEVLRQIIEGGLLYRGIEAKGMDQSLTGREAASAFRLRLKKCFSYLARSAPQAGPPSKGAKEGAQR